MRQMTGFIKGVNLGGWISQFAKYDHEHFRTFITREDIRYIASLGFDHVRVPVDYNVLEDEAGNLLLSGFEYLDNCFAWCREFGLHMLIDLHECYGYSFDPLKVTMDRKQFFYSEEMQTRFLNLWKVIAERYKDYPEEIAFEPLNEVVLMDVYEAWNKVAATWVQTVRTICPNHWLVIGGVRYSSVLSIPLLDPPADDRIVYNFHCYEPMIFTHQGAYWVTQFPGDYRIHYPEAVDFYRSETDRVLGDWYGEALRDAEVLDPTFFEKIFTPALETAARYNVPLYCGEYGVIDLADNPSKIRWLKDIHTAFAKYGIGHALWNYKEKDFGLVDERFAEIKNDFIACL